MVPTVTRFFCLSSPWFPFSLANSMIRTNGCPQKANFPLADIIEAKGMRGREGEAGHDVSPEGKTGETLSSLTVSTKLQWIVEQAETCSAAKSCARVIRTLITEAPDVLIGHIRIRGGPGG